MLGSGRKRNDMNNKLLVTMAQVLERWRLNFMGSGKPEFASTVHFGMDETVHKGLEALMIRTGEKDRVRLIGKALACYDFLTEVHAEGAKMTICYASGEIEEFTP